MQLGYLSEVTFDPDETPGVLTAILVIQTRLPLPTDEFLADDINGYGFADMSEDGDFSAIDVNVERHLQRVLYGKTPDDQGEQPVFRRLRAKNFSAAAIPVSSVGHGLQFLALEVLVCRPRSAAPPRANLALHIRLSREKLALLGRRLSSPINVDGTLKDEIRAVSNVLKAGGFGVSFWDGFRVSTQSRSSGGCQPERKESRQSEVLVLSWDEEETARPAVRPSTDYDHVNPLPWSVSVTSRGVHLEVAKMEGPSNTLRAAQCLHTSFLDAVLLSLVQRDELRGVQKSLGGISRRARSIGLLHQSVTGPEGDRAGSSGEWQKWKKSIESLHRELARDGSTLSSFESEVWTAQLDTGNPANDVLTKFQSIHMTPLIKHDLSAIHRRWQQIVNDELEKIKRHDQERATEASEQLNRLVVYLGPVVVCLTAASVAPEDWNEYLVFSASLFVGAFTSLFFHVTAKGRIRKWGR